MHESATPHQYMIRFISSMTTISLFAVMVCHAQQKTGDAVQDVNPSKSRELIKQWVQTERLISEEKTSWEVKKQQMQVIIQRICPGKCLPAPRPLNPTNNPFRKKSIMVLAIKLQILNFKIYS